MGAPHETSEAGCFAAVAAEQAKGLLHIAASRNQATESPGRPQKTMVCHTVGTANRRAGCKTIAARDDSDY
jgi:hypothetical protein